MPQDSSEIGVVVFLDEIGVQAAEKELIQGGVGKMNEDEHFQGLVGSSSEQGERWEAWEMGGQ